MKILSYFLPVIFSLVLLAACHPDNEKENTSDSISKLQQDSSTLNKDTLKNIIKDTLQKEKKIVVKNNSKYICPQSDKEGNSNKPGECPVCGMELIENPDYTPEKPK